VEKGSITLIGATTENPSFEVISPLLSRTRVVLLHQHSEKDLKCILNKGLKFLKRKLSGKAQKFILESSNGDARILLTTLEIAANITSSDPLQITHIEQALQKRQLGFDKHDEQLINKLIISPYGMILASGPANSGKTTLLYSMLKEIAAPEKNIVALEDPVEYNLEFVRQSQINPARNFTYEAGLRSILRQDPDVIMIGEIRDRQTAENAIHISLTGRLLLTTIHANNSVGTVARLLDIKVSPPLIAYSVNGIIAQRLARRICNNCKITHPPESGKLEMLGIRPNSMPFFKGKGCDECLNTGYYGRVGIFEILVIDDEFRKTIVGHESIEELITLAEKKGLKTLRQDGIQKMKDGITTIEEVLRLGI